MSLTKYNVIENTHYFIYCVTFVINKIAQNITMNCFLINYRYTAYEIVSSYACEA